MSLEQNVEASEMHEESGLNYYEMTVFEKLQPLIPLSEANHYKDVCNLFDLFLDRGLYAYYDEGYCDTHAFLTRWITESEQRPEQILNLVKHVFQIVVDKEEAEFKDSFKFLTPDTYGLSNLFGQNQNLRSWLVLAYFESLTHIPNLIIEGTWENVLYELLKYIRELDIDTEFSVYSLTSQTAKTLREDWNWLWIIEIACSPMLCPSPYLRLEIFRFMLLFDAEEIVYHAYGKKTIAAYVECMSSINPEQLFVTMDNYLLSLRHLMLYVCKLPMQYSSICNFINDKLVKHLHLNQIGKEVRFFANTLKVIGLFAQIAKTRYKAKSISLRRSLNLCMFLLMFGNNNFSENVYNHKLLHPYTCFALANITDGILTLSVSLNTRSMDLYYQSDHRRKKRILLFNKVVKRRNDLAKILELPKEQTIHVKLCQREKFSHNFHNVLLVKKAALALTEVELCTVNTNGIDLVSYSYNEEDDDSQTDSEGSSHTNSDYNSHTDSDDDIHTIGSNDPYTDSDDFYHAESDVDNQTDSDVNG